MNCEEIKMKEEKIFEEYKKAFPEQADHIVYDGLASVENYMQAPVKIVFLLKEVNDEGGGGWDLRDVMCEGERTSTWNNVTQWTEGLFDLAKKEKEKNWEHYANITEDRRKDILKYIGAVNLKKIPGSYVADGNAVFSESLKNKDFLLAQLDLYQPDILICGGTFDNLYYHLLENKQPKIETTTRGIQYCIDENNTIIIDYHHPAARAKAQILLYALLDAVAEIKNKHSI